MTTPPKHVRTAYAYYVQDHYRRIARLLDTNVPQAIFRALADEWNRMNRDDKSHYYNRQARDRDRYRVAREEWMKLHRRKPPRSRRKKDPKAPTCQRNAYIFYFQDCMTRYQVRLANPYLNQQELVREISRRWRALSDEDKEPYREMARNDRTRYEHELKLYHYMCVN